MSIAAVFPAPIAYTRVVAVKKLVVEFLVVTIGQPFTGIESGSCGAHRALSCLVWDPRHLL